MLSSVDLPQPLGPTTVRNSPAVTSRLTPAIAWIVLPRVMKSRETSLSESIVMARLGVTSLLALVLLGTVPGLRPTQVFGGFAFPVVFFLIGGVAIAIAVERTGLAARVARQLLAGARGRPGRLYAQLLVSLPAMAVFLPSAITRNAILIPAYRESLDAMGLHPTDGRARAVMLTLGVLNPLASSALLTGGIASMTAASLLGGFSWLRWFVL